MSRGYSCYGAESCSKKSKCITLHQVLKRESVRDTLKLNKGLKIKKNQTKPNSLLILSEERFFPSFYICSVSWLNSISFLLRMCFLLISQATAPPFCPHKLLFLLWNPQGVFLSMWNSGCRTAASWCFSWRFTLRSDGKTPDICWQRLTLHSQLSPVPGEGLSALYPVIPG